MEFRLLGPFDVQVDGDDIQLGGAKQRALLAILAIHANEILSVDRLIDDLWGEAPPPSAAGTLQTYVSRLRKILESRNGDGNGARIVSRAPGYGLHAEPEQLDSNRFGGLVEAAHERLGDGRPDEAAALLREALGLWRGPALADFRFEQFAQTEIERLEELRLTALAERIDADLACGRHAQLVPELEALVAEHPLRERFREQLMLALYRSGRQADALASYRTARQVLVDELGIEPGPRLRELERAILAHDPALGGPSVRRRRGVRPRLSVVVIAAVVVLASAAAAFLVLRDGGGAAPAAVRVAPHSVVLVDPATNRVVASRRIGGWPMPIVAGGGYLWAANTGDDTVSRIDPVRRLVLDTFYATTPLDLAWRDNVMWIANGNSYDGPNPPGGGTIERYDIDRHRLVQTRIAAPGDDVFTYVAAGREGVWAGSPAVAKVFRLDPRTGRIAGQLPATIQVSGIATGFGSVWVSDAINDTVYRFDAKTVDRFRMIHVGDGPRDLAVGENAVWVVGEHPQSGVWRIDPRVNRAVAHVQVPASATSVTTGAGSVWVTSRTPGHAGPGSLTRIDPATNKVVATIDLGFSPQGVVVAHDLAWVVLGPM